jgi:hypothetical protein
MEQQRCPPIKQADGADGTMRIGTGPHPERRSRRGARHDPDGDPGLLRARLVPRLDSPRAPSCGRMAYPPAQFD